MIYASAAQEASTTTTTKQVPLYPFLSQPPPQKKLPTQPLPSPPTQAPVTPAQPPVGRRRSATTSVITAWRAEVHPGSPAPYSPRRSPLFCGSRRASGSRPCSRRPSVSSGGVPPASFFAITPSIDDFKEHDLTALGYTSVFVHFPGTPISPELRRPAASPALRPSPTKRGLKPAKSLTSLKSAKRARSRAPPSPPFDPARASAESKRSRTLSTAAIAKSKKSKYAKLRPAPLANDLALAQLIDGGDIEDHVKRYAESRAKVAGAAKVNGQLVGVGDVWRDGAGGIWCDQDEELEYTHLLAEVDEMNDWVQFESSQATDGERRESVSTQDSDLSSRYAMSAEMASHDDLATFGQALLSPALVKPGMSMLTVPARSRRAAKHLRKPEFLLDVFTAPRSPASPRVPHSLHLALHHAGDAARPKGKARRRPAPLKLVPLDPVLKLAANPEAEAEQLREDFLMDSFRPRPRLGRSKPTSPRLPTMSQDGFIEAPRKMAAKPSIMSMKELFKAALGGKKTYAA